RWLGVSIQPPVPGKDAFKNVRGDTHKESPVVLMICSWVMPWARSRSGSICTWSCRSRWPQTETLATPGTPIRRGLIVQRASTDSSSGDSFLEDTPIIMVRLVADTGLSITGRCDTFGSKYDRISRSCTSCRACIRLVPGWKISWTDDMRSEERRVGKEGRSVGAADGKNEKKRV